MSRLLLEDGRKVRTSIISSGISCSPYDFLPNILQLIVKSVCRYYHDKHTSDIKQHQKMRFAPCCTGSEYGCVGVYLRVVNYMSSVFETLSLASCASFGARAGKDLMWYARDNKLTPAEAAASAREEIERVKQEEEDAIRVFQLILNVLNCNDIFLYLISFTSRNFHWT